MFSFYRLLERIEIELTKSNVVKDSEVIPVSSNKPQYDPKEVPSQEDEDNVRLGYGDVKPLPEQTGVQNVSSYSMGDKTPNSPNKTLASDNPKALLNLSPYRGKNPKEKSQVSLP